MSEKKPLPLLGRLALQLKLIQPDQLRAAMTALPNAGGATLGEIMVEMGFMNPKQLAKLETVQRDVVAKHRAKKAAAAATSPAPQAAPTNAAPSGDRAAAGSQPPDVIDQGMHAAQAASPMTSADVSELATPQAPIAPTPPPARAEPATATTSAATAAAAAPAATAPAKPSAQPAPMADSEGAADENLGLELVLPTRDPAQRQKLEQLLRAGVEAGASDIHIHSGGLVKWRVNGELLNQGDTPMARADAEALVSAALTDEERAIIQVEGELDYCLDLPGVGRFRANAYRQQRGFDSVFRVVSAEPPTLESLKLPKELAKYTKYHQGMVLITGPAGCGKSATMAAMVNLINEEREEHILCIEDPIEIIHPSKKCLVNQRHAGQHTASFARALRGALREDPDVIVIGELRDLETISLAMTAAETGHFVLATLHTNNAVRTINRMIGAFPSNQQAQVRTMLSESLRAVISQRLVPTADGQGRVPALEILVLNKAISNLVRDEKTVQVRSAIQTGKAHGMYLLEQRLDEMVQDGTITREVALQFAEDDKLITAD